MNFFKFILLCGEFYSSINIIIFILRAPLFFFHYLVAQFYDFTHPIIKNEKNIITLANGVFTPTARVRRIEPISAYRIFPTLKASIISLVRLTSLERSGSCDLSIHKASSSSSLSLLIVSSPSSSHTYPSKRAPESGHG